MSKDYSNNIIKDYIFWTVSVCENQGYLGRCILWCKRDEAKDLCDATKEEIDELMSIIKDLKAALTISFQPDWFNYSFLGNETRHLHGHLVPRYEQPREYLGIKFEDKYYGHNFRIDNDFVTSTELLRSVKIKLIEALTVPN
ncbi:HIT domain-containing protein [Patescibacteria group bacterium]|nr:HIT domain-containing protein [Patescibacteria group bacterium]